MNIESVFRIEKHRLTSSGISEEKDFGMGRCRPYSKLIENLRTEIVHSSSCENEPCSRKESDSMDTKMACFLSRKGRVERADDRMNNHPKKRQDESVRSIDDCRALSKQYHPNGQLGKEPWDRPEQNAMQKPNALHTKEGCSKGVEKDSQMNSHLESRHESVSSIDDLTDDLKVTKLELAETRKALEQIKAEAEEQKRKAQHKDEVYTRRLSALVKEKEQLKRQLSGLSSDCSPHQTSPVNEMRYRLFNRKKVECPRWSVDRTTSTKTVDPEELLWSKAA